MKPLFIYDGKCGFCKIWVARYQVRTGERVHFVPFQETADQFSRISREEFERSAKLVEPDGTVLSGAATIFRTIWYYGGPHRIWWLLYQELPGFAPSTELVYRLVALNRNFASKITVWSSGRDLTPPSYQMTREMFLRFLGLLYFIAIVSLWTQIDGLVGSKGILPFSRYLDLIRDNFGSAGYWQFPTLAWLSSGDAFLHLLCSSGAVLSLIALLFPFSSLLWFLLWIVYLSLVTIGQDFLSFQWDILLLETGFLAIFLNPLNVMPKWRSSHPPLNLVIWLNRWLLFRLMFSSGVVKLATGDPTWRGLTALNYHYQTQPLPTWMSWYVHQLPEWFQKTSVAGMFFIELAVPFLIFAPRRLRSLGCALLIFLQLMIIGTGNYCFFNLLSILLCIWLLHDASWPIRKIGAFFNHIPLASKLTVPTSKPSWSIWIISPITIVIGILSIMLLISGTFRKPVDWPGWIKSLYGATAPFHIVNTYGLFSVMTTERPEIIVEGSDDGANWEAYEFRYKPGDLSRRPGFVAPHQPRLDWQMWFAALGDYQRNPWFVSFCVRLMQGSQPVLRLLRENPFPEPPKYLRAQVYYYQFTDFKDKEETGNWWKREFKEQYIPTISQAIAEDLARQLKLE